MKPVIARGLEAPEIRKRISKAASHLFLESRFLGKTYDLVQFPHDSSHVVTSRVILKAIGKITPSPNQPMVFGWDFTIEAREALDEIGAIVLSERFFGWSDERWIAIH